MLVVPEVGVVPEDDVVVGAGVELEDERVGGVAVGTIATGLAWACRKQYTTKMPIMIIETMVFFILQFF